MNREDFLKTLRNDSEVKQIIRNTINESNWSQDYWKKMMEQQELKTKIASEVQNQLGQRLDELKSKVNKLKEDARKDLLVEVVAKIPKDVAYEISQQMPSFLQGSQQMKEILDQHSVRLNKELETSARQTLERIVNEDDYHEVNEAYFKAFDVKSEQAIQAYTFKVDQQLDLMLNQNGVFQQELQEKADNTMKSLTTGLQQLQDYQSRVEKVEKENQELRQLLRNHQFGMVLMSVGMIALMALKFY